VVVRETASPNFVRLKSEAQLEGFAEDSCVAGVDVSEMDEVTVCLLSECECGITAMGRPMKRCTR